MNFLSRAFAMMNVRAVIRDWNRGSIVLNFDLTD